MFRPADVRFAALLILFSCILGNDATAGPVSAVTLSPTDVARFHEALAEKGMSDKWEGDPIPLASEELRAAYPGVKFLYTFKSAPLPPGAPMPELIASHQRAMEAYEKKSLRITIGINDKGFARAFKTPADFNVGLRPITTDAEAKMAAAAILSLIDVDEIGPSALSAEEVSVTKSSEGWTCRVAQVKGVIGMVTFDQKGHCISATKSLNYSVPVPP